MALPFAESPKFSIDLDASAYYLADHGKFVPILHLGETYLVSTRTLESTYGPVSVIDQMTGNYPHRVRVPGVGLLEISLVEEEK